MFFVLINRLFCLFVCLTPLSVLCPLQVPHSSHVNEFLPCPHSVWNSSEPGPESGHCFPGGSVAILAHHMIITDEPISMYFQARLGVSIRQSDSKRHGIKLACRERMKMRKIGGVRANVYICTAFPGITQALLSSTFLSTTSLLGWQWGVRDGMPMTEMAFSCKKRSPAPSHPALCSRSPDKPHLLTTARAHGPHVECWVPDTLMHIDC